MPGNIDPILRNECGLVKDRPIIAGVSGGPDSLCLMDILRQAGYSIIVAHFDHRLREDSRQDALMVEEAAARLMLECIIDSADVRTYSSQMKLSLEEAARNLRYRFLFKLARQYNAQAVAVGHTADDQVETILMHFIRGSGIAGLKGMSSRTVIKAFDREVPVVRPLLNMWREETIAYCASNGLDPHYDSSNESLHFQRNRIRHLLIPALERFNPKFRNAVLRMSHSLQWDYAFVMETLETAWRETVTAMDEYVITFDFHQLSQHSIGLQRNLVKHAMQNLQPGINVDFSVLERATNLIKDSSHSTGVDLKNGLCMLHEADNVYIYTSNAKLPFIHWPQMPSDLEVPVSIPGQVVLAGGWKLNCEHKSNPGVVNEQAEWNKDPYQVWLDAERVPASLELRIRRPGDTFVPLGMDGHSQKLSDFFVNEKVPQRARERWPLLCARDEIIWVPGFRPAHPYRLTSLTKRVVYFSVSKPLEEIHK